MGKWFIPTYNIDGTINKKWVEAQKAEKDKSCSDHESAMTREAEPRDTNAGGVNDIKEQ